METRDGEASDRRGREGSGDIYCLAASAEGERLATSLTEQVVRRAFAAGLRLASARGLCRGDPELGKRLDDAIEELDELVRSVRRVAVAFDPSFQQDRVTPVGLVDPPASREAALCAASLSGVELGYFGSPDGLQSGDWGGAVAIDESHLLVFAGVVSGHDTGAAEIMTMLRNLVRMYALDGCAPGAILRRCSRWLAMDPAHHFATAICGSLDVHSRELSLVSAGHPAPLVIEREDSYFVAPRVGPPIGVTPGSPYNCTTVTLPVGSTLVTFTDGVVERRSEAPGAGHTRLQQVAAAHSTDGVGQLLAAILEELPDAEDDVALLGLRLSGETRAGLGFESARESQGGSAGAGTKRVRSVAEGTPRPAAWDLPGSPYPHDRAPRHGSVRRALKSGLALLNLRLYSHWTSASTATFGEANPFHGCANLRYRNFSPGSIGSKIEAACRFVETRQKPEATGCLDEPKPPYLARVVRSSCRSPL